MQYKALSLLFLSATALAAPGPKDTESLEENPEYQAYMSSLDSLASQTGDSDFALPTDDIELPSIPSSIMAVLATAVPPSFFSQLNDPAAVSSLDKDWEAGKYPEWYTKMPDDVQDYISSQVASFEDEVTTRSAKETGSSSDKGTTAGSASATATSTGSSDTASSSAQTTGSGSSTSAAETSGSQGATSEGGAPAPTGAMAASLAGAAGILGLAIAL